MGVLVEGIVGALVGVLVGPSVGAVVAVAVASRVEILVSRGVGVGVTFVGASLVAVLVTVGPVSGNVEVTVTFPVAGFETIGVNVGVVLFGLATIVGVELKIGSGGRSATLLPDGIKPVATVPVKA